MDPEYFPVQDIKKQLASLDAASAGGSAHQAITPTTDNGQRR